MHNINEPELHSEVDCSEIDVKTATLISADSCPSSGEGTVYFKYLITETDEYQKCGKRCPYVQRDNGMTLIYAYLSLYRC